LKLNAIDLRYSLLCTWDILYLLSRTTQAGLLVIIHH